MKKIVYGLIVLALALGFGGCAGKVKRMDVAPEGKGIEAPQSGKSQVIFMRPSGMGYAVQSSVFEIKNNKPSIVGIVAAKTKVAYEVEPGEHLFMVVGESGDFMAATLEADKTYYAMVTPRMGWWKARFSLKPVHKGELSSDQFKAWLDECQLVELSKDTEVWAKENSENVQQKYDKYYKAWLEKEAAERPKLSPEDGQ